MSTDISPDSAPAGASRRSSAAGYAWVLLAAGAFVIGVLSGRPLGPTPKPQALPGTPQAIAEDFQKLYYNSHNQTWNKTFWLGTPLQKCPLDLFIFQEILYETQPDVIVEAGTYLGGSALYFASIFDLLKRGRVITIDIVDHKNKPKHDRITYLLGSSTSPEIAQKVKSLIRPGEKVMVVLDSDHKAAHVLQELRIYGPLVTPGNYLIVEDTNINGHPVLPEFGPGPMEALQEFLKENSDFVIDPRREKFMLTFNPRGYLRKTG